MRLLASYAYLRKDKRFADIMREATKCSDVMIDSGAFSAYWSGVPITLDEYMRFLSDWPTPRAGYIALDVLMNFPQSMENLRIMRDNGFDPMPVLTEDARAEQISELNSKRICLAGGPKQPNAWYIPRLRKVRGIVGDDTALHGLAFTRGRSMMFARSSLNSSDSSSYLQSTRYGRATMFDRSDGVIPLDGRQKWMRMSTKEREYIVRNGVPASAWWETGHFSYHSIASSASWVEYGDMCEGIGKRLYFAIGNMPDLRVALYSRVAAWVGGVKYSDFLAQKELFKKGTDEQMLDIIKRYAEAAA
jgi:hypothetical protein